jgi:two-component system phosphate regulon sensor histidine kinase PhoR
MTSRLSARAALVCGLIVLVAFAASEFARAQNVHGAVLLAVAVVAAVAAALVGVLAFRHAGETLREVSAAANRLAEGALYERVAATSGPTGELTRNFNTMAARLEQLFKVAAAEQARLEAVFEASADAMVALAPDTSVQFMNAAALRLFRTDRVVALDRPFIETAVDYELDALVRKNLNRAAEPLASVITFGAQRLPLRAVALPIPGGGNWALLLVLTDLTDVQRIDQVRRDFLSNVSHELRTPLAAVRAMVETVENGDVEDEAELAEFMRRIRQQVHRLTLLVNELLDLSRIESGAIELRPEVLDAAAVVEEAVSGLAPQLEAAGISVEYPRTGPAVEADRSSLLRIVTNLLDNAAKYSPRDSTVHVELSDEDDLVALTVRDDGPGIAGNDLPRVFERFYKGDASRAAGGVGLGLAIVKHLVRSHGGTVEASNAPEGGAVFTVRLPRTFAGARPQ